MLTIFFFLVLKVNYILKTTHLCFAKNHWRFFIKGSSSFFRFKVLQRTFFFLSGEPLVVLQSTPRETSGFFVEPEKILQTRKRVLCRTLSLNWDLCRTPAEPLIDKEPSKVVKRRWGPGWGHGFKSRNLAKNWSARLILRLIS